MGITIQDRPGIVFAAFDIPINQWFRAVIKQEYDFIGYASKSSFGSYMISGIHLPFGKYVREDIRSFTSHPLIKRFGIRNIIDRGDHTTEIKEINMANKFLELFKIADEYSNSDVTTEKLGSYCDNIIDELCGHNRSILFEAIEKLCVEFEFDLTSSTYSTIAIEDVKNNIPSIDSIHDEKILSQMNKSLLHSFFDCRITKILSSIINRNGGGHFSHINSYRLIPNLDHVETIKSKTFAINFPIAKNLHMKLHQRMMTDCDLVKKLHASSSIVMNNVFSAIKRSSNIDIRKKSLEQLSSFIIQLINDISSSHVPVIDVNSLISIYNSLGEPPINTISFLPKSAVLACGDDTGTNTKIMTKNAACLSQFTISELRGLDERLCNIDDEGISFIRRQIMNEISSRS